MKWVMRKNPNFRGWYEYGLGKAYYMAGQTDNAIEWYKNSVKKNPKYVDAYVNLAVVDAELGRENEMRSVAAEILRLKPAFTVHSFMETASLPKDPKLREHFKDMLLKAGLPE